jgi:hypothetical protein
MIRVANATGEWLFLHGVDKLRARARLPGAYAFDCAGHALRLAQSKGVARIDLLAAALGSSWLVNNTVPSPIFRRWLTTPLVGTWLALLTALEASPWASAREEERWVIEDATRTLAVDGHGAGALSKVIALLFPDLVPLMPDAAIAFAIGAVPLPPSDKPDEQTAPATLFGPMMDWFTQAVTTNEGVLETLAETQAVPPLSGAQALDRLLWFDSVGYRHFRSPAGAAWWSVVQGDRRAVVPVNVPLTIPPEGLEEPIDLSRTDLPEEWMAAARQALDVELT